MKTHFLKTNNTPFKAVKSGAKNFEFRKNDRKFMIGDKLVLSEYDGRNYTGRQITAKCGYILYGGEYGVPKGYCVISLHEVQFETENIVIP